MHTVTVVRGGVRIVRERKVSERKVIERKVSERGSEREEGE